MVLHSYAKLNLYLEVLKKRPDGYHELNTLFERIDLKDTIVLNLRKDSHIHLECKAQNLPKDPSQNLVFQSARLLQKTCGIEKGTDIKLIKRIPVAAGLGGGSSNAASVLMGLNRLWGLGLSRPRLACLAASIGSDVAFFIYDCPFAQGRGRGERIRPLPQLNSLRLWHVLAVPDIRVSTAAIYRAWDTRSKKRNSPKRVTLTIPRFNDKISALRLKKCSDVSLRGLLHNDLQAVTSSFYPEVRQIQDTFKQLGLKSVLMSGSGPAVFATVSSGKEAAALCRQLKKRRHSWRVFRVRTR